MIEAAYETFKSLAVYPRIGKPRSFRNHRLKNIRSWQVSGFENYLIFYRPISGGVQILHVYHGARNIEALFGEKI